VPTLASHRTKVTQRQSAPRIVITSYQVVLPLLYRCARPRHNLRLTSLSRRRFPLTPSQLSPHLLRRVTTFSFRRTRITPYRLHFTPPNRSVTFSLAVPSRATTVVSPKSTSQLPSHPVVPPLLSSARPPHHFVSHRRIGAPFLRSLHKAATLLSYHLLKSRHTKPPPSLSFLPLVRDTV
jgi:hypothetical protein